VTSSTAWAVSMIFCSSSRITNRRSNKNANYNKVSQSQYKAIVSPQHALQALKRRSDITLLILKLSANGAVV
jgi:hypothetical protein